MLLLQFVVVASIVSLGGCDELTWSRSKGAPVNDETAKAEASAVYGASLLEASAADAVTIRAVAIKIGNLLQWRIRNAVTDASR